MSAAKVQFIDRKSSALVLTEVLEPILPLRELTPDDQFMRRLYGRNACIAVRHGCLAETDMCFDGPTRIDGHMIGDIFSSSIVLVGPSAIVEGNIQADAVLLYGHHYGDIRANFHVKVFDTGCLVGDVRAESFCVAPGGAFAGMCRR